jgi:hypothetical protein
VVSDDEGAPSSTGGRAGTVNAGSSGKGKDPREKDWGKEGKNDKGRDEETLSEDESSEAELGESSTPSKPSRINYGHRMDEKKVEHTYIWFFQERSRH